MSKAKRRRRQRNKSMRALRADRLNGYAEGLRANLPKSEAWFLTKYSMEPDDLGNVPLGLFIPDIHNKKLKYVIEIDGSFHDKSEQQARDRKKDAYFFRRGYQVFRVVAYCEESFAKFRAAYTAHKIKTLNAIADRRSGNKLAIDLSSKT